MPARQIATLFGTANEYGAALGSSIPECSIVALAIGYRNSPAR